MDMIRLIPQWPWIDRIDYIRDMQSHDAKYPRLTSEFSKKCDGIRNKTRARIPYAPPTF